MRQPIKVITLNCYLLRLLEAGSKAKVRIWTEAQCERALKQRIRRQMKEISVEDSQKLFQSNEKSLRKAAEDS